MGKLGYSTYTLTDLTETLPISLVLETNQEQNVQIKEGEFYTPNFEGEELIITPSLFLGSIEKEVPTNYTGGSYIYYETGEMEELEDGSIHEKQYYYYKDNELEEVYVDVEGRLHYKKNLKENLTIEAYIVGFKNKVDQDYVTSELVRAQNPITILLLEQGKGIYTLVISSSRNREHFEENNKEDIILTATLYKGAEPILDGVEYEWDIVTDMDTEQEDDDYSDENNKNDKTDFISRGPEITIQRTDVDNIQVYQCTATFNGLEFSAQKIIRDFTDGYTNQLIADSSLILTPNKTTVTLTNQVWYQAQIINGKDADSNRFNYKWVLLKSDNINEEVLEGTGKTLTIDLNAEKEVENEETGEKEKINIYPKENFSILGMVTIDGKTVTVNYADIKYQPVAYSVNVSPKTIFIPTNADGTYRSTESFIQEIKFQLLDDKKQFLDYILETDSFIESQGNISVVYQTPGKWDFTLEFNLTDFTDWEENQSSKTYEFKYTYLNQSFTEEFEVVKNYAGADGEDGAQGFSGYTIDLSNEFYAFAGGEMRADSDQSTTCTISAYFGDKKQTIKKITIGNSQIEIYSRKIDETDETKEIVTTRSDIEYVLSESKGFLYISSAEGENVNEVLITIRTNNTDKNDEKFLTGIEPILFFITIQGEKEELTFFKAFTYTINYNGKSYYLNLSSNSIKYTEINQTYDPSNINVSALCRETSGQATPYTNGKIVYSLDNKKTWKISTGSISGYKNLENIYIRLYSAAASSFPSNDTIFNEELTEFDKYLLDTETIPILTSLEGYEFGGENLLRWTKALPIETNKWALSSGLAVGVDGDFSTMDFALSENTSSVRANFRSPKINFTEDYKSREFCFSCYIYSDDWSTFSDSTDIFDFVLAGYKELTSANTCNAYGSIGIISPQATSSMILEKNLVNGEWIKVYKTFTFNQDFFTGTDVTEISSIEELNYFNVLFYIERNGSIRIKKPKLELGNVPSAWSASPYDLDYSDIVSQNLGLSSGLRLEIKRSDPYFLFGDFLLPSTTYTFSFSQASWSGGDEINDFYCYVCYRSSEEDDSNLESTAQPVENLSFSFSNNIEKQTSKTFITPEDGYTYSLRIYATNNSDSSKEENQILTLQKVKLEQGAQATSFFLTDEELEKIINNSYNNTITYIDEKGNSINAQLDSLTGKIEALQGSSVTINDVKAEIEAQTTDFYIDEDGYLNKIKGRITLEASDAADPYIEIATESAENSIKLKLQANQLGFYQGTNETEPIAYMTSNTLNINSAKFEKDFSIGNLLVSVRTGGIGFSW